MKNKILILILTVFVFFGTSSCTDWLDLRPESEIILDDYWKTESDAEAVVAACYRGLITDDCTKRMIAWGELRSDEVTQGLSTSSEVSMVMRQEVEPTNDYCKWGCFYEVINYCNTFLKYAPQVLEYDDNFTQAKLDALTAEVLTIRSFAYFYLVRAFGNVPWISTPSIDDTQNYLVTQSSERVVLDSIISNLQYAGTYAKNSFETTQYTKGRITKSAVYSLLADVYLWDQQYDNCIKACDKVLANKQYSLVDAENMFYQVFYKGNSTESIFELQFDDDVQQNYGTRYFYGNGSYYGLLTFPSVLVKSQYSPFDYAVGSGVKESVEDIRSKDFFVNNSAAGYYYVFKYAGIKRTENAAGTTNYYSYRDNTSNWIVYRLSDIYLMKAEALLQRDQEKSLDAVISLVNKTYHRSNPDVDTLNVGLYNGVSEVQSLVLRERQRELMFEGKRWFDLVRLARRSNSTAPLIGYVSKTTGGNEALSKMSTINSLYWPVAESELQSNPKLVQNPFYETVSSK
jgi:starch-binding outer membrane protein, SusD/RagB family